MDTKSIEHGMVVRWSPESHEYSPVVMTMVPVKEIACGSQDHEVGGSNRHH